MRLGRWKLVAFAAVAALCFISAPSSAQEGRGTITGHVTAAGTKEPLAGGRVMLVGTSIVATTQADGDYTLRNVPAGAVQVRVLRVGYKEAKLAVTVVAGQTVTLDISMEATVVQLAQVVTTATGQQRRVELGNSVATLGNVNEKVSTTPISNLADLMVGKVAGVVVLPGAMTGSAPVVRIRGQNSMALGNDPIYIIDGVRMYAGTIGMGTGGTSASYLNDLDPNNIQDVEIVKGPSAATLYGTDAANGVIVITTKRGQAGATRWSWYAENGAVQDRNDYKATYASWGHDAGGNLRRCILLTEAAGTCTLDSLTSFNVLTDPSSSPLFTGRHQNYGGQVSGGSNQVRFFVSGNWQDEIGPLHMPTFAQNDLVSGGTPLRDEWVHPEAFQTYGARANLSATLSPKVDLTATAGYTNTNQRLPQVDNNINSFIYSGYNNPGFNHDGVPGMRYSVNQTLKDGSIVNRNGYGVFSPAQIFQDLNTNGTQRFIGSSHMNWRPLDWMNNQATIGMDLASSNRIGLQRFGEGTDLGTDRQGSAFQSHTNHRNLSAKLISTSSWQARSNLIVKTTVGADYTNEELDGVSGSSENLPPGSQTVGDGAVQFAGNTLQTVDKTLGIYLQEEAAWRDRMFFSVAARSDQNSSFGENFNSIFYPKVSLSWIISDEDFFPKFSWLNMFRLRSAFGASGVSPGGTVRLTTFNGTTVNVPSIASDANGADTPALRSGSLGNPNLKPERSAEFEGGFESDVWDSRAHLSFTYYHKKTSDALINKIFAASSGSSDLTVLTNMGSVMNAGVESNLSVTALDRPMVGVDFTVSASHNTNKILSLGFDDAGNPNPTVGAGGTRDSVGLPISGAFARPYTYSDANGNGIIEDNEVTVDPNYEYIGYRTPRDIISVTTGVDLWHRQVRVTVLTDNKGGGTLFNSSAQFFAQNFSSWYSNNLITTPLWDQARGVAQNASPSSSMGYYETDQYWKLREVSAAWTLPASVNRAIRAHDAQLVFTARNLFTWTNYSGPDPEANYSTGSVQTDFSTLAPPAYFLVRLNLHF